MADPIDSPYLEEAEPSAPQTGVDSPGPRGAYTDLLRFGIYNGNFRTGPAQPASNIDVASSLVGSNFVPGWRFVQSSGTAISGKILQTPQPGTSVVLQGAGSNFRWTHDATSSSAAAFLEQIVDISGSVSGTHGANLRVETLRRSGTWTLRVARQYLAADGTIAGMPAELVDSTTFSVGDILPSYQDILESDDYTPSFARYVRLRLIAESASANGVLDLFSVRRTMAAPRVVFSNRGMVGFLEWEPGSNLIFADSGGLRGSILNRNLVALSFVLPNIPAGATTEMQPSDNALGLATPRIPLPFPGSLCAVGWRISAIPGAGTARIDIRNGASVVWQARTIGTGSAANGYELPGTAAGLDSYRHDQGDVVGVDIVASGALTAGLDLIVTLYYQLEVG